MTEKPLYFSRSDTKTVLRLPESFSSFTARMLTIRNERRKITIFLTLCDKEEATHVPVATYKTMENAIADMEEVNRILSEKDYPLIGK
jgi:hypothetical protein